MRSMQLFQDKNLLCGWEIEEYYWRRGYKRVCGVDEAGRGPLAGPVVAAAVILDPKSIPEGINDSKKISPKKREELFSAIIKKAYAFGFGLASSQEIDTLNILNASLLAMKRAIKRMRFMPDFVLVDGKFSIPINFPQKAIIKGDSISISIAAASILAKVLRDRLMKALDKRYPGYNLAKNKGYPTKEHKKALSILGACPIHRKSFKGVGICSSGSKKRLLSNSLLEA